VKAAPFHVLLLLASNRLFVGIVTELGQQVARIGRQARAVREVVAQGRVLRCIYGTASAVSGENVRTGAFQETTPRSTRARQHFPSVARARARARGCRKSKAVACRQGRAVGDRPADPVREKCTDPHGCPGRRDSLSGGNPSRFSRRSPIQRHQQGGGAAPSASSAPPFSQAESASSGSVRPWVLSANNSPSSELVKAGEAEVKPRFAQLANFEDGADQLCRRPVEHGGAGGPGRRAEGGEE
jgi:hypothetical protein